MPTASSHDVLCRERPGECRRPIHHARHTFIHIFCISLLLLTRSRRIRLQQESVILECSLLYVRAFVNISPCKKCQQYIILQRGKESCYRVPATDVLRSSQPSRLSQRGNNAVTILAGQGVVPSTSLGYEISEWARSTGFCITASFTSAAREKQQGDLDHCRYPFQPMY